MVVHRSVRTVWYRPIEIMDLNDNLDGYRPTRGRDAGTAERTESKAEFQISIMTAKL